MKFKPGESGNPLGKKKGTIHKRSELAKVLDLYAEKLIIKVIEMALTGDPNALRLCLERLMPKVRSERIDITLPNADMTKTKTLITIGGDILKSIANQEITPEQGKILSDIVENQRKNIESNDLVTRVNEIHQVLTKRKPL